MIDRTAEAERVALEDLLSSDGWAIYMEHVALAWGPAACEEALRTAKQAADPQEWPFEATRILDTFAATRADLRWPEERVRALKSGERAAKRTMVDRFSDLRRKPR